MTHVPSARIGMFIDGTNADIISKFYRDQHPIQKYIILSGLMHFLRTVISKRLDISIDQAVITQAHYYIGLKNRGLERTRELQEALWKSGVILHTFPLRKLPSGANKEVGVDVALTFDATKLAMTELDIIVILTGDGDFFPLVSGLRSMKKMVVLPYWNLQSSERSIDANANLVNSVDIALNMRQIIDTGLWKRDRLVAAIFEPRRSVVHTPSAPVPIPLQAPVPEPALRPEKPAVIVAPPPAAKIVPAKKRPMRLVGMISEVTGDQGHISRPIDGGQLLFTRKDVLPAESSFGRFAKGKMVRFSLKKGSNGAEDTAVAVELLDS